MTNENMYKPSAIPPEDVLKPQYVQDYKKLHEDIWHRLVETNTNVIILERIQSFPFHHFYSPNENIFWMSVYWNFFHISIITIHAIINDRGNNVHTLEKFKDNISKEWLIDSEKDKYFQNLRKVKFDQTTKIIRKKITSIRDGFVHRLFDNNGNLLNPEGITVTEIRHAYDDVERLFHACSFGSEYIPMFMPYLSSATCGGKPIETDIAHLLDLIVKDSSWLNQPERNPQAWQICKKTRSSAEILDLNQWRKKFGMPEV